MIYLKALYQFNAYFVLLNSAFFVIDFFWLSRRPILAESYRYSTTGLFANLLMGCSTASLRLLITLPLEVTIIWFGAHVWPFAPIRGLGFIHILLSLVLCDLVYYIWHRSSHNINVFWFAHQAHHQDTHYNVSTSLRFGFLETLTLVPTAILGCVVLRLSPLMVGISRTLTNNYMFWLHSSVGRLPKPVEFIFNTASHHRMHHEHGGRSGQCNYGGILIIWDRIFGTFRQEPQVYPTQFGVTGVIIDVRPFAHQFHGIIGRFKSFEVAHNSMDRYSTLQMALGICLLCSLFIPIQMGERYFALAGLIPILGFEMRALKNVWLRWSLNLLQVAICAFASFETLQLLQRTPLGMWFSFSGFLSRWLILGLLVVPIYKIEGQLSIVRTILRYANMSKRILKRDATLRLGDHG